MEILAKVGGALQRLFGEIAQKAAAESGVIQRRRKFDPVTLAKTWVLGMLQDPKASDEKLAQMAVQCGASVTPQAVEQRHSPRMVDFLEKLFRGATQVVVGSNRALAPILERFTKVILLDSSTITLPDEQQEKYRGCGGRHGSGVAAMKLQTEWDLRSGALSHVQIEPGRSSDGGTSRQDARHGKGSLRIADLGYFALAVLAAMATAEEYFLSRLQFGTHVLLGEGLAVDMLKWLTNQTGPFVDVSVLLGEGQRLPCRLIAWRMPQEQANRRRQKLRHDTMKKRGGEPSAERLAWCDWTILVTNIPLDLMTPPEAAVLYRARWQVELLFKRWKSQGLVAQLSGSTAVRQMVRVWSRLLAVLVQHWLIIGTVWGNPTKSLHKAYEATRAFVSRLAAAMNNLTELEKVLQTMSETFAKTCGRNKRSKTGTNEMLNNIDLLDFCLT
jgi:Transposase DDE domain